MKTFLVILAAATSLLLPLHTYSQSTDISELETALRSAAGPQRVEVLLALTNAHLQAGDYDKALEYAENATSLAERIKRNDLKALSLSREGKVLMLRGKKGLFAKDPASRLRESNKILGKSGNSDKTLLLENLEQLRALAVRNNRNSEVADIDAQIARAKEISTPAPGLELLVLEKQQEIAEQMAAMNNQILELSKSQQGAAGSSNPRAVGSDKERQKLMEELSASRALIDKMTDDQLKASLLLMQQRTKLDSMEYRNKVDSLNIANAELAVRESRSERNFYIAGFIAVLLLAGGSLYSFIRARQNAKVLGEKNKLIRAEQERSENLLLNILPALVAEELKKQGSTNARYFEDVSVLFADFVGFSKIAEKLTPQQLVTELDTCFRAFDEIIARHGLEKIKTIGDAYMAAGGLPNGGGSQLRDMIEAAREMQTWLATWNAERARQKQPVFEARIGIHSGPVVAGVVGSKKFAFDIWGDTVNIAARIEAAGEGGKINISGEVFEMVKDYFACKYRGKIAAKNKGEIDMYFVEN
ncbi:MAG: adenylate/guanylate cyclase domain-containing protein [Saprospiraceae bacterium]|jgi:adenylate cyclase|nr:adenylate/guanylate cyclase domain-containing protein [Saprospiraceae bacterium]